MAKYRTKPRVVEAFQWTGDRDQTEGPIWIVDAIRNGTVIIRRGCCGSHCGLCMEIFTPEGWRYAYPSDWIVQDFDGINVVKAVVFGEMYEPVQ